MVGGEHADAVGVADQEGRGEALVRREERPPPALADQLVLVVDEDRRVAAAAAEPRGEQHLDAEDERVMEVEDVEAAQARDLRDERRVPDRELRLDAVHDRAPSRGFDLLHIHYPFIFGVEMLLASRLGRGGRDAAVLVHYKNELIGEGGRRPLFAAYERMAPRSSSATRTGSACSPPTTRTPSLTCARCAGAGRSGWS